MNIADVHHNGITDLNILGTYVTDFHLYAWCRFID